MCQNIFAMQLSEIFGFTYLKRVGVYKRLHVRAENCLIVNKWGPGLRNALC
jgi:hypothetical protein